ncbi:hypothetical protein N7463_006247 [Penicillium fimorum]|uniref:Uncharacterized protein n=1 Tax=Penicillium fimorum TaxID=1882269 RepID=A0A9X0C5W1_9EURO|nr:hypothetical protein N7463_006247 [Penicillium fimorum]
MSPPPPPPPPPPPLLFEDPWKTWTTRLDGDDSHLIGKVNPVDNRRPCLELGGAGCVFDGMEGQNDTGIVLPGPYE